jgi:hypothetical protein
MTIPDKKIYRNGKLMFDPNNPEDVKNYREKQPLMEAFNLVRGLTDPRGGGGLFGMARKAASKVVSKAVAKETVKKAAKSTIKTGSKKAKSTVKEIVEKKPTIPTNIPSTMELAQIPGSSVKTIKEGIKSFTGKAEKFVPKTSKLITRANTSAGNLKPFKGSTTRPGSTPMNYTPTDASKALSSIKEASKVVPKMPKEKLDIFSKLVLGTAGLGIAGGIGYQGYKGYQGLTSKPIDLNNINENDLSDSTKYKDVKILKTSTGDKGIIKDPKTGKWKYFNEKEGVKLPKGNVGLGDGPPIGLNDNNQNKGNNQGSNKSGTTTPRSKTRQAFDKAFAEARKQAGGAAGIFEWNGKKYGTALKGETVPKDRVEVGKTTTPLMGDEEYKKDPRLATLRQQDDDRQRAEAQKKEMMEFEPTEVLPFRTKPLSSLVFKTAPLNPKTNSRVEPVSYSNIETNSKKLKKKSYGGNLAMLKYMK